MRLRSRGLGRKELVLDFREYDVIREKKEIVIVGTIRDPVKWEFSVRMCEDDVPGMTRLLMRRPVLGLLLRGCFRRNREHHWTQERSEHIARGKEQFIVARQKAADRMNTNNEAKAEESETAGEVVAGSVVPKP